MDDANELLDQYTVTPEWVTESNREEQESRLIPKGTFDGQITGYTTKVNDKVGSPFYGHPVARITAELFSVEGSQRLYFFSASPHRAQMSDGRDYEESRNFRKLAEASETVGEKGSIVLQTAQKMRLSFKITLSPAKGDYPARNWTDNIKAAV